MHAIKKIITLLHILVSISPCANTHAPGAGMGTAQIWLWWSRAWAVGEPSAWHMMQKGMAHQEGLTESKKVDHLVTWATTKTSFHRQSHLNECPNIKSLHGLPPNTCFLNVTSSATFFFEPTSSREHRKAGKIMNFSSPIDMAGG